MPDEPMFVLLGRDKLAPLLVNLWALGAKVPRKVDPKEASNGFQLLLALASVQDHDRVLAARGGAHDCSTQSAHKRDLLVSISSSFVLLSVSLIRS
jgi:hypothetical protein